MARVSVVIPVYNIEAHLRQCLDSVVGQTLRDIEIICVDDGSTDTSSLILGEYAAKDGRFRILSQENGGPGAARNKGLEQAKGEFLVFLDSDDWFEPDFLEQMTGRAREAEADVTICRSVEFDTDSGRERPSEWMLKTQYLHGETFAPREIAEYIFQFTYGWPWDKLYRTKFIRDANLFYPDLSNSEDLVFVFQSLVLAEHITILDKVLVHHRVNRMTSVSNSRWLEPEIPYRALAQLRDALKGRAVYAAYEHSFLNWAMEFLIWNVANMGERQAREIYFRKLKREWLPQMGFERHPAACYDNRFTYAKYLLIKYAPYPVFTVVLKAYKSIKKGGR